MNNNKDKGLKCCKLFIRKGLSVVVDVMDNTLGCKIGYGVYSLILYGYEKVCKRSVGIS